MIWKTQIDTISGVEQKSALLRCLSKDFDVATESVMSSSRDYYQALPKIIVREVWLEESKDMVEMAMTTQSNKWVYKMIHLRQCRPKFEGMLL